MLSAEMDRHLGCETAEGRANTRNGYVRKTVLTDTGRLALDIPRDRQGTVVMPARLVAARSWN
jgi:putative transposase